jgi:hypothetical protein
MLRRHVCCNTSVRRVQALGIAGAVAAACSGSDTHKLAAQAVRLRQEMGTPVRYTEFTGRDHGILDRALNTPGLYSWLFAQHR